MTQVQQDARMGKAAGAAYRAGAVKLVDFVGVRRDPDWGDSRYAKSLRAVVGDSEAKRWMRVASGKSVQPQVPAAVRILRFGLFDNLDAETDRSDENLRKQIVKYIDKNRVDKIKDNPHGTNKVEDYYGFQMGGQTVHYTLKAKQAAVDSVLDWYTADRNGQRLPEMLVNSTHHTYFTFRANSADSYWAKQYKIPGFVSRATGGDGNIVVYRNQKLPITSYTHEMGHNLANELYKNTHPTPGSRYETVIQSNEKPVSEYATKSSAEDFAEAVKYYVTRYDDFRAMHPLRFAVIDDIMRNGHE